VLLEARELDLRNLLEHRVGGFPKLFRGECHLPDVLLPAQAQNVHDRPDSPQEKPLILVGRMESSGKCVLGAQDLQERRSVMGAQLLHKEVPRDLAALAPFFFCSKAKQIGVLHRVSAWKHSREHRAFLKSRRSDHRRRNLTSVLNWYQKILLSNQK
jgi:hypothetical protein